MNVKILYEDKDLIVVVKPAGMPSQGDRSSALDMVSWLKNYLKALVKGNPYIAVVHRLDRPVGGVMVYAKNEKTAADLSKQIQNNQVCKKYKAVLTGIPQNDHGQLEDFLLKDAKTNTSRIVKPGMPQAKKAQLEYQVIAAAKEGEQDYALADIHLITGRHHQIRVQMAGAGHGIYGDTKYNPYFQTQKGWHPIGLFSYSLSFCHPITHQTMTFEAEPEGRPFDMF